jgi:hypothetical protein
MEAELPIFQVQTNCALAESHSLTHSLIHCVCMLVMICGYVCQCVCCMRESVYVYVRNRCVYSVPENEDSLPVSCRS